MAGKAKENGKGKKKRTQRWSIGVYRNPNTGRLATVYVTKEGVPMPSQQERVGDQEILHHDIFTGMPYREARQKLIKAAAGAGHSFEVEVEPEEQEEAKKTGSKSKKK